MFNITRTAAAMTKIQRRAVKLVGQGKINPEKASDAFKLLNETASQKAPHSTNVLKRAYNWCKTFVANFKDIKKGIKAGVDLVKTNWDEAVMGKLTKGKIKEVKTSAISLVKESINVLKAEMKTLLESGKKAGAKVAEGAADAAKGAAK